MIERSMLLYTNFVPGSPWGHFGVPVYHSHPKMAFACGRSMLHCLCTFINSSHYLITNCDTNGFTDPDLSSFTPVIRNPSSSSYILQQLTSSTSHISRQITTTSATIDHYQSSSPVIIAIVIAFIALTIAITASSILIKVSIFSILL